jgi:hypothetical protein
MIARAPVTGASGPRLPPRRTTSGGAPNTARTAPGFQRSTIGASSNASRTVNASPWRSAQRRRNAVGRVTHSSVCSAAGSGGPGGSAASAMR